MLLLHSHCLELQQVILLLSINLPVMSLQDRISEMTLNDRCNLCYWPLSSALFPVSSSTSPRSCAWWRVTSSWQPPPKSSWSRRSSCCWPSSPSCRSSCTTIPSCRSAPCTPCRCIATPARSLKVQNLRSLGESTRGRLMIDVADIVEMQKV